MTSRVARVVPQNADQGLSIRAVPLHDTGTGTTATRLLTPREQDDLRRIAMRLRLPARMVLYREEGPARWVFAVTDGVVKTYRDLPSGKRRVQSFLFAGDLFGLAEQGRYVNSAQTITAVTLYRLPVDALTDVLQHDAELQFRVLSKVAHELREQQRRGLVVTRRDAAGRLAMFLCSIQQRIHPNDGESDQIVLPMTRSDIAAYLALSLEAVSRASAELTRRGIVRFEDRHLVRVLNQSRLIKLAEAV